MAVTKTSGLTTLADKLIVNIDADTDSSNNVSGATSGSVYIIEIDATKGVATTDEPACYVKLVDASSATGGGVSSTVPDVVLFAPIGVVTRYVIKGGWAFTSGLSFWCVTTSALTGDTSPTSDVKVSIISS
tara:strand:- start:617 stop:1009 length:393 start_codon:yes stop_codon:yes gene_type:complete